jgi:hypothetical protein
MAAHQTLTSVRRKHAQDTVLIVDGALVAMHDRRMAASSIGSRWPCRL